MNTLRADWQRIGEVSGAPLIVIRFGGTYPPGSDGNAFAAQMVDALRAALDESGATRAVIDLTDLDYKFGDAIGELAMQFLPGKAKRAAVVASEPVALALKPLTMFSVAAIDFVSSHEEALQRVEQPIPETRIESIIPEMKLDPPPKPTPQEQIFDPIAAVLDRLENVGRPFRAFSPEAVAANFRRIGADASDRLAELIAQEMSHPYRINMLLGAVSPAVVLTPRLRAVLTEIVSAPKANIDPRALVHVRAVLDKPKASAEQIVETLRLISGNRKLLEDATGPLYFSDMARFGFAMEAAESISDDLFQMLKRAAEQLEIARQTARESKSSALTALDEAERELSAALRLCQ